jgi:hypothetical protein
VVKALTAAMVAEATSMSAFSEKNNVIVEPAKKVTGYYYDIFDPPVNNVIALPLGQQANSHVNRPLILAGRGSLRAEPYCARKRIRRSRTPKSKNGHACLLCDQAEESSIWNLYYEESGMFLD